MDSVLTAINDQHTPKFTLEHITWVRTLEFALSSIGRTEAEDPELYQRISPITGVAGLKTPLLIIHSDGDRNVAPEPCSAFSDVLVGQVPPLAVPVTVPLCGTFSRFAEQVGVSLSDA